MCVCACYACVCVCYSSQAVWAISRWVSSLTLRTCVFVCVWGSGVMWCETGRRRIGSVGVCVCVCVCVCVYVWVCYWRLRQKLMIWFHYSIFHCNIWQTRCLFVIFVEIIPIPVKLFIHNWNIWNEHSTVVIFEALSRLFKTRNSLRLLIFSLWSQILLAEMTTVACILLQLSLPRLLSYPSSISWLKNPSLADCSKDEFIQKWKCLHCLLGWEVDWGFIVHKPFLELHNKTVLQHFPKQLK